MAILWVQESCACISSSPCFPQRTGAFPMHPDFALNKIKIVFTYWQSQGKELFLPPAWLLKIKAENSNLKRQLKETRKFFCITQQLFLSLSLSKFPSTHFLLQDFCRRREEPHFNFPAVAEIAAITPDPAKQNKLKENLWISRSLPKIKSENIWGGGCCIATVGSGAALPEPRLFSWEKPQISLPGLSSN